MEEQQEKRGPGRPRKGLGSENITMALAKETIEYLRSLPSGHRSKYVEQLIARDRQEQKGNQS